MSRYFDLFARLDRNRNPSRPGWIDAGPWRAEVENFVARLYLLPESPAPQVVAFVRPEPGNGWSWLYPCSGDLLASSVGSSVCVLETDSEAPSLLEQIGLPRARGLTDLLADPSLEVSQVVEKIPGGDLWLLTRGQAPSNGNSPLCSDRLPERLSQLRSRFEFLLIDTPPVSRSPGALAIAPLADGVVLVLDGGHTRGSHCRRLAKELEGAGASVLGVIFTTGRTFRPPAGHQAPKTRSRDRDLRTVLESHRLSEAQT